MRPWLHIPVLIFLGTLALAIWITFRDVQLDRHSERPVLAQELERLPPPAPTERLVGILVDEQGRALADADLSTQQDGRVLWARSNREGRFALEGLLATPLQVSVLAPGRLPEVLAVPGPADNVRLALRLTPEASPEIPRWEESDWSGWLRNPLDPNALGGYQVWLVPTGPADEVLSGVPRRAVSNSDGSFVVTDLIHAPYFVHVLPPERDAALEPNLLVALGRPAPVLKHDHNTAPDAWSLVAGELFGTLRSEGIPVRAGLVMLEALEDPDNESGRSRVLAPVQSDARGRWRVPHLPPARYRVSIRGGGLHLDQEIELPPSTRLEVKF